MDSGTNIQNTASNLPFWAEINSQIVEKEYKKTLVDKALFGNISIQIII